MLRASTDWGTDFCSGGGLGAGPCWKAGPVPWIGYTKDPWESCCSESDPGACVRAFFGQGTEPTGSSQPTSSPEQPHTSAAVHTSAAAHTSAPAQTSAPAVQNPSEPAGESTLLIRSTIVYTPPADPTPSNTAADSSPTADSATAGGSSSTADAQTTQTTSFAQSSGSSDPFAVQSTTTSPNVAMPTAGMVCRCSIHRSLVDDMADFSYRHSEASFSVLPLSLQSLHELMKHTHNHIRSFFQT